MQNLTDSNIEYLSIRQACAIIPGRPHFATVWRWAMHGVRGQRLQTWVVGGQRFTTREGIEDFLWRLNPESDTPKSSTPRERQRAIEAAEKQLSEWGI